VPGAHRLCPQVAPTKLPPYFVIVLHEPERLDPAERAREKRNSREADARDLASGAKSRDELRRENGVFAFPKVRVSLRGAKPLE
jgi:hypothetical protein